MGGEISSLVKRAKANDEELGAFFFEGESALNAEAVQALVQSLNGNTHVVQVDFTGHTAAGAAPGAKAIGEVLQKNKTVRTLRLAKTGLGDSGAAALVAGLGAECSLKILDVRSADIGVTGMKAILVALASNTSLEELRLDDNPGLAGAGDELVAFLSGSNKSLKILGLSGGKMGLAEVARVAAAVQARPSQLQLLDLSNNALGSGGDAGVEAIAALLGSPSAPVKLVVASNGLSSSAGGALLAAQAASSASTGCQQLDLQGNPELTGKTLSDAHELFLARAKMAREKRAKDMGLDDD